MTSEGLGEMFEGDSADTCAGKFPPVPMGHARPSAQPPIDVSGNFPAPVSAESPSNISPNPSEVISKVSELYNKSLDDFPVKIGLIWGWRGVFSPIGIFLLNVTRKPMQKFRTL